MQNLEHFVPQRNEMESKNLPSLAGAAPSGEHCTQDLCCQT